MYAIIGETNYASDKPAHTTQRFPQFQQEHSPLRDEFYVRPGPD
jgi:hypothetical protein